MKNIYFETYGCTSNKADTRIMEGLSKRLGHNVVENINKADLIVLNTCVVIRKTENRMLNRIKELKDKNLVVAGCISEINKEEVKKIDENIPLISPRKLDKFAKIIGSKKTDFPKWDAPSAKDGVKGQIQISEGCVGNCSYCITKFARGNLQPFPKDSIAEKAKKLVDKGVKEIQLTAQDTATYGLDEKNDLVDLISEINQISGDFRIRIGMMNPSNVINRKNRLLKAFEFDEVYNFLHLPVQSGSDSILEDMNRKYFVEDFVEIVDLFRAEIDGLLSTDIIAGFPTESDEDFEKSVNLIQKVKPEIINITRFSPRPGTKASEISEIRSQVKKDRSKHLTELKKDIGREKRREMLGETRNVLVVEDGKNDTMIGKDEDYNTVVIDGDVCIGDFVEVKIVDYSFTYLVGVL